MILADENIDSDIVSAIRNENFEVLYVKDKHLGIPDEQVIELSKNPPKIILTEDKDFGEWVFSHQEKNISVIFLRYTFPEKESIITLLLSLLHEKGEELFGKFTTITTGKIRIRYLK